MSQSDFQCWHWLQIYLLNCLICRLWVNSVCVCACVCVVCWTSRPVEGLFLLLAISTYMCSVEAKYWKKCKSVYFLSRPVGKCDWCSLQRTTWTGSWLTSSTRGSLSSWWRAQRCLCHWPPLQPKDSVSYVKVVAQIKTAFWRSNISKSHVIRCWFPWRLIAVCVINMKPSAWVVFQPYGVGSLWECIPGIHLLSFTF